MIAGEESSALSEAADRAVNAICSCVALAYMPEQDGRPEWVRFWNGLASTYGERLYNEVENLNTLLDLGVDLNREARKRLHAKAVAIEGRAFGGTIRELIAKSKLPSEVRIERYEERLRREAQAERYEDVQVSSCLRDGYAGDLKAKQSGERGSDGYADRRDERRERCGREVGRRKERRTRQRSRDCITC